MNAWLKTAGIATMAVSALVATQASAAIVTYNTRVAFDAAAPGTVLEDFEEADTTENGNFSLMGPLLDSSTNNEIFSTGDIAAGLTIQATPGSGDGTTELLVAGAGSFSNTTKSVFANFFVDVLTLSFSGGTDALGFDLQTVFASSIVDVSLFGSSGLLGTFQVNAPNAGSTFIGFISTDAILSATISSLTQQAEGVDNIAFGEADAVPEPALLGLLGLGALALAAARRRRA